MPKEPTPQQEISSLKSEIKEMREIVERFKKEASQAEQTINRLNHMRMGQYYSLVTEREGLMSRVHAIDQRIRALDLAPAQDTRDDEDGYRMVYDHAAKGWKRILH